MWRPCHSLHPSIDRGWKARGTHVKDKGDQIVDRGSEVVGREDQTSLSDGDLVGRLSCCSGDDGGDGKDRAGETHLVLMENVDLVLVFVGVLEKSTRLKR
jgi:hypothetical protein